MKINKIVSSFQRLSMINNKSKYKASVNNQNEEIKAQWLKLSHEASELLEEYKIADTSDENSIVQLYNKEWELYLKMKELINKRFGK